MKTVWQVKVKEDSMTLGKQIGRDLFKWYESHPGTRDQRLGLPPIKYRPTLRRRKPAGGK